MHREPIHQKLFDALESLRRRTTATDFKSPQHQGQRGQDFDNGLIAAWNLVDQS